MCIKALVVLAIIYTIKALIFAFRYLFVFILNYNIVLIQGFYRIRNYFASFIFLTKESIKF